MIEFRINGQLCRAHEGTSVAAAILTVAGHTRLSVTGHPRGPLCGMGVCYECRATVDGIPQTRTCLMPIREGMEIETDD